MYELPEIRSACYIASNYNRYNWMTKRIVAKWTSKCWLMHHHHEKITEMSVLSTTNFLTLYFLFFFFWFPWPWTVLVCKIPNIDQTEKRFVVLLVAFFMTSWRCLKMWFIVFALLFLLSFIIWTCWKEIINLNFIMKWFLQIHRL